MPGNKFIHEEPWVTRLREYDPYPDHEPPSLDRMRAYVKQRRQQEKLGHTIHYKYLLGAVAMFILLLFLPWELQKQIPALKPTAGITIPVLNILKSDPLKTTVSIKPTMPTDVKKHELHIHNKMPLPDTVSIVSVAPVMIDSPTLASNLPIVTNTHKRRLAFTHINEQPTTVLPGNVTYSGHVPLLNNRLQEGVISSKPNHNISSSNN